MSFYLAIISPLDSPLYELSLPSPSSARTSLAGPPLSSSAQSSTPVSSSNSGFPSWSSFTSSADVPPSAGVPPSASTAGGGPGVQGGPGGQGQGGGGGGDRALFQMIAFKALDGVEEVMESTGSLYLRNVDKYNEWTVSAYLAMGVKFVLVHDQKNDDGIRMFFNDLWELWVKLILLNPFHTVNTPIRSNAFETRVRAAARRNL